MAEINEELEGLAEQLNAESDSLHKILETLNKKLNRLKLGIPVWLSDWYLGKVFCIDQANVHYLSEYDEEQGINEYCFGWDLGYAKTDEGWSIAVRPVWYQDFGENQYDSNGRHQGENVRPNGQPRSILKAPREVRIECVVHVETLVEVMKEKATEAIGNIKKARKLAKEL